MIKDAQVRQLRQFLGEGHPLYRAALKVGMDVKSARKYRHAERLPSESLSPRTWRTREDPFQDVWPQLRGMLELNPGLQAKTLFCRSPAPLSRPVSRHPAPHPTAQDQSVESHRGSTQGGFLRSDPPARPVGCLGLHAHERPAGSHSPASRLIT